MWGVSKCTAGHGGEGRGAVQTQQYGRGEGGPGLGCDGLTEQRAAMRGLLQATGFLLRVAAVLEVWSRLCASTAATATCNAGACMLQESQSALWATTCGPLDSATFARGPRRLDASNLSSSSVRRARLASWLKQTQRTLFAPSTYSRCCLRFFSSCCSPS
jgi:hypothetical protein